MRKISVLFLIIFLFLSKSIYAQQPQKPNAVEIYNQIQKLNFLGSVLYIAAHPDDENTRLISYFANSQKARTAYLSLTRGDGGQNLIGPELRELLGTIRTQELLEARKIDGGEQMFSRANDFGFSKTPDETLNIWDKNQVLSDVVWAIRKFQPDVIINRFDHRTAGTTHGHHTASALLSVESFDLANDPNVYPNQLQYVKVWQPKRMFFNPSWFFFGSKEKFDQADKSAYNTLPIGVYFQSIGKSNQEIAALSRSRHQSQGFGTTGTRGEELEYLEFIKGNPAQNKNDLFEGIDTSWNRVKGGKEIGKLIASIEKHYDFKNPSASINDLAKAYQMIQNLQDEHWKTVKTEEIKNIISACAGLYLEAVSEKQEATPGSELSLKLEAINRSNVVMNLASLNILPENKVVSENLNLKNNEDKAIDLKIQLPENLAYTAPYWLKEESTVGMYRVDDQRIIGLPMLPPDVKVSFNVVINNVAIPFQRAVIYKNNDEVKGEQYKPLNIVPLVTTSFLEKVKIFDTPKTEYIGLKIKAGADNVKGNLRLELNDKWKITPSSIAFDLLHKGDVQSVYFEITPPQSADEANVKAIATVNGKDFDKEQININYEHIQNQQVLLPSKSRFIKLDIKIGTEKIGYIMGAGDEVPTYLSQLGYQVAILEPGDINVENLKNFDVIITGIRAYNTVRDLASKQDILFDFVKQGHTMIVQYNTFGKYVTPNIAPFSLKISKDRVTEENAEVRFVEPKHPVLNYPNTITSKDFQGWVQEQGLYYPEQWDKAFSPILSSNDKGESPKNGALLVAKYGKGHYIYTGLSFFRELPAGVPGAYRLFSNLISIKNDTQKQ